MCDQDTAQQARDRQQAKDQYRALLTQLQEKMQAEYDKTVLSLSGGAFGVSVLIIKELIGANKAIGSFSLIVSWIFWAISVLAVLLSFFSSSAAMGKAIAKLDKDNSISPEIVAATNMWTNILNAASGICFMFGLAFFIYFVSIFLYP